MEGDSEQLKMVFQSIQNLVSEDQAAQLSSIKQLTRIVKTLGLERTKNELFPFMKEVLESNIENLLELCNSLCILPVDYNDPEMFKQVSLFFEEMVAFKERRLRNKAIKSFELIFKGLKGPKMNRNIVYTLSRLMIDGHHLRKYAVASLIPVVAERLRDDGFKKLLDIVKELIDSSSLEIRTKTFTNFQTVVKYSEKKFEKIITDLIEMGIDKGPDFVSAQGIPCLLELARMNKPVATSILKSLSSNDAWRVRYGICHNIEKIGDKFGKIVFKTFLTKSLSDYLLDQKSETRIGALDCLPKACHYIDAENICLHLVPCLKHLVNDSELPVRVTLAMRIPHLLDRIGKKRFNEQIIPLVLALLRDEMQEVRSAILDNFEPITKATNPINLSDSLIPVLIEMKNSLLWRYRESALEFMLFLTKKCGREFLAEAYMKIIYDALRDEFKSIRQKASQVVEELVVVLGEPWVVDKIMPEIERLEIDRHYKFRAAYCKYVQSLAFKFTGKTSKKLIQSLFSLSSDSIAIVRIGACHAIESIIQHERCPPNIKDSFLVAMQKLSEDSDTGVAIAAARVLQLYKN